MTETETHGEWGVVVFDLNPRQPRGQIRAPFATKREAELYAETLSPADFPTFRTAVMPMEKP